MNLNGQELEAVNICFVVSLRSNRSGI